MQWVLQDCAPWLKAPRRFRHLLEIAQNSVDYLMVMQVSVLELCDRPRPWEGGPNHCYTNERKRGLETRVSNFAYRALLQEN